MLSKEEKNKINIALKSADNAVPEIWLETFQKHYENGNKQVLLAAISMCAHYKIVMPAWVAENCIKALESFGSHEVKTLDEAFDVQLKKGTRVQALQDRKKYGWVIFEIIQLLSENGTPIDMNLFSKIAKILEEDEGVCFSPEKISQLYYEEEKNKKLLINNVNL